MQPGQNHISDEDYRLIKRAHLGNPLRVYRLQPWYIFCLYVFGLFLQIMTVFLVIEVVNNVHQMLISQQGTDLFLDISVVFCVILVEYFCFISLANELKLHLIICEKGLLQVKKKFRGEPVAVVYWEDIGGIRRGGAFLDFYHIIHRGKSRVLPLFNGYRYYNELIASIKEHIAKE